MALVPVPGSQLTGPSAAIEAAIPAAVDGLLGSLRAAGHAAYVVGGSLRDLVLGRRPDDWDLASEARPERLVELFPGAVYENQFGTVAVRRDGEIFEITTFRTDHDYADFRRPHRVEFGDTIEVDLARRDFTVNAMAWGARPGETAAFIDPYGGVLDIRAGVLRAVGDPRARFEEDALRMIRAVRLAATLEFGIEPATLAGIQARADLVAHLSGERIAAELDKLLARAGAVDRLPAAGRHGLLAADLARARRPARDPPEQGPGRGPVGPHAAGGRRGARRRGRSSGWRRCCTTSASRRRSPTAISSATTRSAPSWPGRSSTGCARRGPCATASSSSCASTCSATRRTGRTRRCGGSSAGSARSAMASLEELLVLREADNVGSGLPAQAGRLDELRARIATELAAEAVLDRSGLAVDGDDLMAELGLEQGPLVGRILDELLERVIVDPALNDRPTLLLLAQAMLTEDR